jgi:hypothetical protein
MREDAHAQILRIGSPERGMHARLPFASAMARVAARHRASTSSVISPTSGVNVTRTVCEPWSPVRNPAQILYNNVSRRSWRAGRHGMCILLICVHVHTCVCVYARAREFMLCVCVYARAREFMLCVCVRWCVCLGALCGVSSTCAEGSFSM